MASGTCAGASTRRQSCFMMRSKTLNPKPWTVSDRGALPLFYASRELKGRAGPPELRPWGGRQHLWGIRILGGFQVYHRVYCRV